MSVLADRHQAGLFHSLQLLFEDRLQVGPVFTPVGLDWWNEGYWRFGEVFGDNRLAQQYLTIEDHGWADAGAGVYTTYDSEFPDRMIFGVTLERAKAMGFERVLASVQENQRGLARFAKEARADYLYQVGNRGQEVDWSLDPLALVSAEAPIKGRGVKYHQEYDKDGIFRRQPLPDSADDRRTVASFVNCLDRMPVEWEIFQAVELHAPEFEFSVHGHDGRDGFISPITAQAQRMATYGFAWHDKPQGDGFGHVLHYWASIGRPLIGHASYYNGLLAAPLWEDGVTCISLDDRTGNEVLRRIREVANDPARHEEMAAALRARVDELVDFDAEEQAIRALLGL